MKCCILIPHYNHIRALSKLLLQLEPLAYYCIIVDDGSDAAAKEQLYALEQQYSWLDIIDLNQNSGKGSAMHRGFNHALQLGYSHALQIDADGQHCVQDIPKLMAAARQYPQRLICAKPIFDEHIPKSRLYGRKITHFWVAIETWSLRIADAMCGFRVYPLQSTVKIMNSVNISRRMDFDIDIIVRHYWAKTPLLFLSSAVTYPVDGVSHFKLLRDNVLISKLHCRLFFGMLARIPQLLSRTLGHE